MFFYNSETRECVFGLVMSYIGSDEIGIDYDEEFVMNGQYFLGGNSGWLFDYDN